jgi:aminopeptidase
MKLNNMDFDQILDKYTDLIIEVGLNLQEGQKLFIDAEPLETSPLARKVAEKAYQHGSQLVSYLYSDEVIIKNRFEHAPRDSFEEFPSWATDAILESIQEGGAYLVILGRDPDLLLGQDPELVGIANRIRQQHITPIRKEISANTVQWLIVGFPTRDWAKAVFPDLDPEKAETRLWEAVIQVCRLDKPDPVAFWKGYLDDLWNRSIQLTRKGYQSLHFHGPGTDLKVGLPQNHIWMGGLDKSPDKLEFCANLPTEELYTLPHRNQVNGTVRATKPLSYLGSLIEDFELRFSEGKVVDFSAKKGEEVLASVLETGPNARYLGEVALVPHSSPISQQDLVFLNTLYDENASCHLALGNAYPVNLEGGIEMSEEDFIVAGGNQSLIHVDFMFGSGELDVDGILPDGSSEPVMRSGEWAFET